MKQDDGWYFSVDSIEAVESRPRKRSRLASSWDIEQPRAQPPWDITDQSLLPSLSESVLQER